MKEGGEGVRVGRLGAHVKVVGVGGLAAAIA